MTAFGFEIVLTIRKPPELYIVKPDPKPDTEKNPLPQEGGKGGEAAVTQPS